MSTSIHRSPDVEHLQLLAVFQYVLGGMTAFTGCIPLIHVTMGIAMLLGAFNGGRNPPPPELGIVFSCFGGSICLVLWTIGALKIMAGRCLSGHRAYVFCYTVAVIECLQVPMGTVLGVFTILVLSRPSVKALFAGIEYRDPRLDALDHIEMDDEEEPPPTHARKQTTARFARAADRRELPFCAD